MEMWTIHWSKHLLQQKRYQFWRNTLINSKLNNQKRKRTKRNSNLTLRLKQEKGMKNYCQITIKMLLTTVSHNSLLRVNWCLRPRLRIWLLTILWELSIILSLCWLNCPTFISLDPVSSMSMTRNKRGVFNQHLNLVSYSSQAKKYSQLRLDLGYRFSELTC